MPLPGRDGTPYYAGVTVILSNGTVLADTYPLLIRTKTIDIEEQVAIDEGLWWLHKVQNRYNFDAVNKGGDWSANGYKISATASAVQAFAVNGHLMTDDASRDPYVDTVQRGVNYLLSAMTTANIGPQPYGDPDGKDAEGGNEAGLFVYAEHLVSIRKVVAQQRRAALVMGAILGGILIVSSPSRGFAESAGWLLLPIILLGPCLYLRKYLKQIAAV